VLSGFESGNNLLGMQKSWGEQFDGINVCIVEHLGQVCVDFGRNFPLLGTGFGPALHRVA
jgi:hypothetical protein